MPKHGRLTVVKVKDSGGTLRDLTPYLTDSDFPDETDAVDVTPYGVTRKVYLVGLGDGTLSGSGNWDATPDGWLAGLRGVDAVDYEYYPAGTATGMVKYAGKVQLKSYGMTSESGGKVGFSFSMQQTGDQTRTVV